MLPDKTIKLAYSTLGVGGTLLERMGPEESVSSLWDKIKAEETVNTYEKYIKGLVLLYSLGAIDIHDDLLRKKS